MRREGGPEGGMVSGGNEWMACMCAFRFPLVSFKTYQQLTFPPSLPPFLPPLLVHPAGYSA
jgi:hypothetical protein